MIVEPFGPEHLAGFRALFESAGSGCFCRYWHFTGTKNEWLARSAHTPEVNDAEMSAAVAAHDDSARGLVALDDARDVVGWMKLTPRAAVPKLTSLVPYRDVPALPGTWSIGCFLVSPTARRHGVAHALVEGAVKYLPTWGGHVLEAYPRHSEAPLYDEEAWQGPESLFVRLGFEVAHAAQQYPMYRKVLPSSGT